MSTRFTEITAGGKRYRLDRNLKALLKEEGALHPVTAQNMQLLEFLVSHQQHDLVTRNQIFEHLYGGSKAPLNQAVDLAIKSLRETLGSEFIKTDHGKGWRFTANIRHFDEVQDEKEGKESGLFAGIIDAARQSGASTQADRLCDDVTRIVADQNDRNDALRFLERYIQEELNDTDEWIASTLQGVEENKKKPKETDGAIAAFAFSGIFHARELSDAKKKKRTLEAMRSELAHLAKGHGTDDIVSGLSKIVRFYLSRD
jgi:DNA-binding winged helix-turn-helix (wHTH) protein